MYFFSVNSSWIRIYFIGKIDGAYRIRWIEEFSWKKKYNKILIENWILRLNWTYAFALFVLYSWWWLLHICEYHIVDHILFYFFFFIFISSPSQQSCAALTANDDVFLMVIYEKNSLFFHDPFFSLKKLCVCILTLVKRQQHIKFFACLTLILYSTSLHIILSNMNK